MKQTVNSSSSGPPESLVDRSTEKNLKRLSDPERAVGLLISVRNAAEASLVGRYSEVAILDVKEPAQGSLGLVSHDVANEILGVVVDRNLKTSLRTSIALGEVVDGPFWPELTIEECDKTLRRFDFVKCGLSGLSGHSDWRERWLTFLGRVPRSVTRVAVAYVDDELAKSPPVRQVLESASLLNCHILLLDTFGKSNGGLFDWCRESELKEIVAQANRRELKVVLAGSLSQLGNGLQKAIQLQPDYVAVRGAVCELDRASPITEKPLEQFIGEFKDMLGLPYGR